MPQLAIVGLTPHRIRKHGLNWSHAQIANVCLLFASYTFFFVLRCRTRGESLENAPDSIIIIIITLITYFHYGAMPLIDRQPAKRWREHQISVCRMRLRALEYATFSVSKAFVGCKLKLRPISMCAVAAAAAVAEALVCILPKQRCISFTTKYTWVVSLFSLLVSCGITLDYSVLSIWIMKASDSSWVGLSAHGRQVLDDRAVVRNIRTYVEW